MAVATAVVKMPTTNPIGLVVQVQVVMRVMVLLRSHITIRHSNLLVALVQAVMAVVVTTGSKQVVGVLASLVSAQTV
jgi:hypothetical protein